MAERILQGVFSVGCCLSKCYTFHSLHVQVVLMDFHIDLVSSVVTVMVGACVDVVMKVPVSDAGVYWCGHELACRYDHTWH